MGIDQFILIQFVAPLASESPEIIIAVLFSLRAHPIAGITALISSEVNQLTLLIGSMTMLFSMSAGEILSFPSNDRHTIEFLLTTAVSMFAILLIAKRIISWRAGAILLVLYAATVVLQDQNIRLIFAGVYFVLAAGLIAMDWRRVKFLIPGETAAARRRDRRAD